MSKIPRSHFGGIPKPQTSFTSTPMETSKRNFTVKSEPPKLNFSENIDISAIENNCTLSKSNISKTVSNNRTKPVPLKPNNKNQLKRSASQILPPIPKKQIKSNNVNVKVPGNRDTRYDDLFEKYNDIISKYNDLSEDLEEKTVALDTCNDLNAELKSRLKELTVDNTDYSDKLIEINKECQALKKETDDLKKELSNNNKRSNEYIEENSQLKSQLLEINNNFEFKCNEYNSLKGKLNEEIKKTLELTSMMNENSLKLSTFSSEIEFLKTKQSILEQKNTENNTSIANLKTTNEKLQADLLKLEEDHKSQSETLDSTTKERDRFANLYNDEVEKCTRSNLTLDSKQKEIIELTRLTVDLNRHKECLEISNRDRSNEIEALKNKLEECQRRIENMHENEKSMRNTIQDLKGHIRVYCRVKPIINDEKSKPAINMDVVDSCTMEIDKASVNSTSGLTKKQNTKHTFSFDGVFSSNSTQSEIFEEVSSLIQSALDGYNVCIFAYGQTGSGKTFTMEGENVTNNWGIVPRAIRMIFDSVPKLKTLGWDFSISASFLEIYNENIYDLLDSNRDQTEHVIKMIDSKGTDVYVSNLKEESVTNYDELNKLLTVSQKNRQTAATLCNERSSRSHSVAKIKIHAVHEKRKEKYSSSLNFIDLAGSESGKTSQRMDETKSINKSLSELSKVILALQGKQTHVPYRNSKLTHLLMPSLSGNSKTLMLVNISQVDECYNETLNSLRFAAKVNSCRTGVSKKNISTL